MALSPGARMVTLSMDLESVFPGRNGPVGESGLLIPSLVARPVAASVHPARELATRELGEERSNAIHRYRPWLATTRARWKRTSIRDTGSLRSRGSKG